MNQEKTKSTLAPTIFAAVLVIALAAVGYLYYAETQKSPTVQVREIAKEVPVEIIREVVKEIETEIEVPVEVPAELTDVQKTLIEVASNFIFAPPVEESDGVFYGIESFATRVIISDSVMKAVSEESIQNKFELSLRKNGIHVDDESPYLIIFYIDGFWDEDEITLTYQFGLFLRERVVLARSGDLRAAMVHSWSWGSFGYSGKKVVEESLIRSTESASEALANRYLKVLEKERKKAEQASKANGDARAAPSP